MANGNPRYESDENEQAVGPDKLDFELDAALARYAAVEPRAGLEQRVLANLRAERRHSPAPAWWQRIAAATLAVLLLVALTLSWRSRERRGDNVARIPSQTTQKSVSNLTQSAHRGGNEIRTTRTLSTKKQISHIAREAQLVLASGPKLDQFPSPQPLSEQEKILESYVAKYPQYAALIAQARYEALRQDMAEEMKDAEASKDFQQ
jgi:hypothetical protein